MMSKPPLPNEMRYKKPGVFPEDVFRCMTENKQIINNYPKVFKKKTDMAMSRFDSDVNPVTLMPGGAANSLVAGNPGLGPLAKRIMMDPEIDEEEALSLIILPQETIYMIDKVVRLKARNGPIGIDNSEVINLQVENEFKKNYSHVLQLNSGMGSHEIAEDIGEGYIDKDGKFHGSTEDEKLF